MEAEKITWLSMKGIACRHLLLKSLLRRNASLVELNGRIQTLEHTTIFFFLLEITLETLAEQYEMLVQSICVRMAPRIALSTIS